MSARSAGRRASGALALTLALAACTGGPGFDADALAPGACRDAAEPLEQVDSSLRDLQEEEVTPEEAAAGYQALQDRLLTAGRAADPAVAGPVRDLVSALGFIRAGAASGTYTPEQAARTRAALDAVLTACGAEPTRG